MILFITRVGHALLMTTGMFWDVGWSLVLGFLISGVLQVFVSQDKMTKLLGKDGPKEILLATGFGAASSSCSYASASITRTLIQKGAGFISSLAFLLSSTNLVIELGLVLYLLMGWQFMAAEWIGGVMLVIIMSILVKLTYPKKLIVEARHKVGRSTMSHQHSSVDGQTFIAKLLSSETRISIAQNFVMDWSMLWKDLLIGFVIAGFLSEFIPDGVWQTLFVTHASPFVQMPLNAIIGPVIAIFSFVCSIGNVPMAAVLWGSGISFGGVLAFLYADLIVLPLLDVYRRYFGWKMAVYIGIIFYVTMVITGIVMDLIFTSLGLVPHHRSDMRVAVTHFAINYTFWLNLVFAAIAVYSVWLSKSQSTKDAINQCDHHTHH